MKYNELLCVCFGYDMWTGFYLLVCGQCFDRYLWAFGKNVWKRWKKRFFVLVQVGYYSVFRQFLLMFF